MKVIFSRKGFDSKWGGSPSPIMPDGTLLSLPIPDKDAPVGYNELFTQSGLSYLDLMRQLPIKKLSDFNKYTKAHVDPDLRMEKPSAPGWRPAFGQSGGAQGHLLNEGVQIGDLFLFFGWFRQTEMLDGRIHYQKGAPHLHVLFGYLEIGEILEIKNTAEKKPYPWLSDHPHVFCSDRKQNTVYLATERLSFNSALPGAGKFRYNETLVLTVEGKSRSHWLLPACFHPSNGVTVSYHRNPKRWQLEGKSCELKSVAIGQEFVVSQDDAVEAWAKELINYNAVER